MGLRDMSVCLQEGYFSDCVCHRHFLYQVLTFLVSDIGISCLIQVLVFTVPGIDISCLGYWHFLSLIQVLSFPVLGSDISCLRYWHFLSHSNIGISFLRY